ncbi:MAG: hypothetical protein ABSE15_03560 [Candidatus Bathyarchaeia archaeon]
MQTPKIILMAALAALVIALVSGSFYAYYTVASKTPTTTNPTSYSSMMGSNANSMTGMMGTTPSTAPTSSSPAGNSLLFTGIIGYVAVAAGILFGGSILTYYLKYPKSQITTIQPLTNVAAVAPYDSVAKTLTPEERQVLNVLLAHNGKYLQKYVRNETGLSRLKTHRIVSRLAQRGIVTTEKTGNTNEVILSDWLNEPKVPAQTCFKTVSTFVSTNL